MRIAILAAAMALSGCAVSPDSLKADAFARSISGSAPTPVEVTYRRLVTGARRRYEQGGMTVQGDYFPDVREGRVDVFNGPGVARATIDLTQDGAGTAITARYSNPLGLAFIDQEMKSSIVQWANGEPGFCYFTPTPPENDRSRQ